jgi:excisionase family DNA binding protein
MRYPPPGPEGFLDFEDGAARLGVTPRWMRRQVLNKAIPYYKIGGMIRFDSADLDAYIASARIDPKAGPLAAAHKGGDKPSVKPTR